MRKLILLICCISTFLGTYAKNPVSPGSNMTNFTLKSTNGETISLADFQGKNVMLVFPRGKVGEHWCNICHYQYAELAELEAIQQFRKKYDIEVLYILPYNEAEVKHWVSIFPSQLAIITKWKNPVNMENLSKKESDWMNLTRRLFPKDYNYAETGYPMPFPVLIDTDHTLSSELGIFSTDWDGSKVDQNMSSIYIVDKVGSLRFKYVSQNTFDRPQPEYLFEIMHKLL